MVFNPHHPGWYHFVPYLYHSFQEDYEAAQAVAARFNTPDYFWDPLVRAAVLGQLGRQEEAAMALRELLALVPDFRARGRSLAKRMLFQDEHVDMIWDALVRAGLERLGDP